jgi:hypothetical protein
LKQCHEPGTQAPGRDLIPFGYLSGALQVMRYVEFNCIILLADDLGIININATLVGGQNLKYRILLHMGKSKATDIHRM